ncbi:MAG: Holliday junction resolvase RecU [Bacilli bacterium]|nr:Holliday junction resolvase RecU [Bacilli bacterium]
MKLENLINLSNEYYLENDIAVIYKKPTPILVCQVDYKKNLIKEGYYKVPSTLDYNGIYRGKYIDFDAKETLSKTSFPLSNLHDHQLLHMKRVIKHGGISFLIIKMNSLYYLLDGKLIIDFIENNDRKSIPYEYIENNGIVIKENIRPALDYIKVIDSYYFKEENL